MELEDLVANASRDAILGDERERQLVNELTNQLESVVTTKGYKLCSIYGGLSSSQLRSLISFFENQKFWLDIKNQEEFEKNTKELINKIKSIEKAR